MGLGSSPEHWVTKTMLFPAQAESQPFYLHSCLFFFFNVSLLTTHELLGFLLIFIFCKKKIVAFLFLDFYEI